MLAVNSDNKQLARFSKGLEGRSRGLQIRLSAEFSFSPTIAQLSILQNPSLPPLAPIWVPEQRRLFKKPQ